MSEPGTGTQWHDVTDDDGAFHHNERRWEIGDEFVDTDIGDVCKLVGVYRKSRWCDTGDDGVLTFVFEYERYPEQVELTPGREQSLTERFVERYQRPSRDPERGPQSRRSHGGRW